MPEIIAIPAGARVKNVATGRTKPLEESLTVAATYRVEDDTWVFMHGGIIFGVKLTGGD